jgi:DNA-3-methyladenine glycosylase
LASKTLTEFLNGSVVEVAKRLLGCELEVTLDGMTIRVRIVETESYDQTDVASHSYKGQTQRTKSMFGPSGYLYVYFTYGMHYCCNIVVGEDGYGAAVLLRAVEPLNGADKILARRRLHKSGVELTNGPAKLCQAMGIDRQLNGHDLTVTPLKLIVTDALPDSMVVTTTRIGISRGTDLPWRFYIKNNPFVSVK